jgi:hypothetical protein
MRERERKREREREKKEEKEERKSTYFIYKHIKRRVERQRKWWVEAEGEKEIEFA